MTRKLGITKHAFARLKIAKQKNGTYMEV